jgi:NOL1/NOP2/fmu family ribosome biogenesis protein
MQIKDNLKVLNSKETKPILELIKKQWQAEIDLDYAFLQKDDGSIYLINREISNIDLKKLRINSLGLYFGFINNNQLRLSIEGSQIIGPKAKINIIKLNDQEIRKWLQGQDIETKETSTDYVLIKNKTDFFGTGKIKNNYILNFVPKERRLKTTID